MATTPPYNNQKRRALKQFMQRNSNIGQKNTSASPGQTGPPQRMRSAQDQAAAQYAPGGQKKQGLPKKRRFPNNAPYARY